MSPEFGIGYYIADAIICQPICQNLRRINRRILKYVPIDATKKTDKKTSHIVNFITSMALRH